MRHRLVASCTHPDCGQNQTCNPGMCRWPGIEPMTLWCLGRCSNHWPTLARAKNYLNFKSNFSLGKIISVYYLTYLYEIKSLIYRKKSYFKSLIYRLKKDLIYSTTLHFRGIKILFTLIPRSKGWEEVCVLSSFYWLSLTRLLVFS